MPCHAHFAGIEFGGTRTTVILGTSDGVVIGCGRAGPSNTNFVDFSTAQTSIQAAWREASGESGLSKAELRSVVVATEIHIDSIRRLLAPLGCPEPVTQVNEGEAALVGGLMDTVGVSLICGTGSVGWGRSALGATAIASSWGVLGDEGSGFHIGSRGINAAFKALDGRGPATRLVAAVEDYYGTTDLRSACPAIYGDRSFRKTVSAFAPLVLAASESGDVVARSIVRRSAESAAEIVDAVFRRLFPEPDQSPNTVLTGGLLDSSRFYYDEIAKHIIAVHPKAKLMRPLCPSFVGTYVIGMLRAGNEMTHSVRSNLLRSWADIRDTNHSALIAEKTR